jgi:hypothetical protein
MEMSDGLQKMQYAAPINTGRYAVRSVIMGILGVVRIPLYGVLELLYPFVFIISRVLALLFFATALFARFVGPIPNFPFWMGIGIGLALVVIGQLYDLLMRRLAP